MNNAGAKYNPVNLLIVFLSLHDNVITLNVQRDCLLTYSFWWRNCLIKTFSCRVLIIAVCMWTMFVIIGVNLGQKCHSKEDSARYRQTNCNSVTLCVNLGITLLLRPCPLLSREDIARALIYLWPCVLSYLAKVIYLCIVIPGGQSPVS